MTIQRVITPGVRDFKRGALVGGFESIIPFSERRDWDDRDRDSTQFLADSLPKSERPLHHFYVSEVTEIFEGRTVTYHTITVHVENLKQAEQLFLDYEGLTLYPLNFVREA